MKSNVLCSAAHSPPPLETNEAVNVSADWDSADTNHFDSGASSSQRFTSVDMQQTIMHDGRWPMVATYPVEFAAACDIILGNVEVSEQ